MRSQAASLYHRISATMVIVQICDHFLGLKVNWFDTLTVKQWEIMINNDVSLSSVTNGETLYEQLLHLKPHNKASSN